jgi:ABC-2 type transport system ATP-binding protein
MSIALSIQGLVKRYGDFTAVDHLSLDVPEGEFFGFLGPNGAGKTTTINAIVGLVTFQEGSIRVCGHDVTADYRKARACIGLAPQEFNFDRYLTIHEVLLYTAGYFGVPAKEAKSRADQMLKQFDLYSKRDVDFTKLSGGMKRRLSLARALVHQPRVLILDEPTAGVDVELRLELWDALSTLNREGLTIILTTHYLEEAQHLCKRIGIINHGRIVALDKTESLIAGRSQERIVLEFETPVQALPTGLETLGATWDPTTREVAFSEAQASDLPRILGAFEAQGHHLTHVDVQRKTLQDVFLELTARRENA